MQTPTGYIVERSAVMSALCVVYCFVMFEIFFKSFNVMYVAHNL